MNFGKALDDFIAVFSPERALRRRSFRDAYFAYDAASPTRKDLPFGTDGRAEDINSKSRNTLRARARNLERNSDVMGGMLYALENNVVGSHINMQATSKDEDFNKRIEELFHDWEHCENCDVTGQQNLTELTKLVLRRIKVDGGILATYVYDDSKYGMKIQMREVDELVNTSEPKLANGNVIANGIEMTPYGKPVSYFLNRYDANGMSPDLTPEQIKAEFVDFLWRKDRPSQYREIPPMARSITRIADIDDYTNAVAFQQKTNACTSAFIETDNYNTTPGRIANTNSGEHLKELRAGSIIHLKPGEKMKQFIPGGQATEMENFVITELRMISASHGLSLESATRNVERVNYSSARQNMLADQLTYKEWQQFLIEHFLRRLYKRFVKQCWLLGLLKGTGFNPDDDDFYRVKWLTEGLPWIDPKKEADANTIQLGNGGLSFQKYCADNGVDWRERLEEMAEVQKYAEQLGVKLNYIESVNSLGEKGGEENGDRKNTKGSNEDSDVE